MTRVCESLSYLKLVVILVVGMFSDTSPKTALENAKEHEQKFEWLEAAKSYGQTLEQRSARFS